MNTLNKTTLLLFIALHIFLFSTLSAPLPMKALGEATISVPILNVRSGPSLDDERISQVGQGEKYQVLEEIDQWYKIRLSSTTEGWIASWFVQFESSGEPSLIEGMEQKADEVTEVSEQQLENDEQKENINTRKQVQVNVNILNMRAQASLDAEIIKQLPKGTLLEVIHEEGAWYEVIFQEKRGWIASWLVDELYTPSSTNSTVTILHDETNLREGPGTHFAIVNKVNAGDSYKIVRTEGDWFQVDLGTGESAYVASWLVSAEEAPAQPWEEIQSYLQNRIIMLDPGHGGKDNGATGSFFETLEKVVNLQVARLLQVQLEEAGATVIMTRDADVYLTLQERVDLSILHKVDAFISIHHNTHPKTETKGTITYFYTDEDGQLASFIHREVVKYAGLKNMNTRHAGYFVLRENPQPAVLIELGFISNYQDELTIRTSTFQENAATGILIGLANYFKYMDSLSFLTIDN